MDVRVYYFEPALSQQDVRSACAQLSEGSVVEVPLLEEDDMLFSSAALPISFPTLVGVS